MFGTMMLTKTAPFEPAWYGACRVDLPHWTAILQALGPLITRIAVLESLLEGGLSHLPHTLWSHNTFAVAGELACKMVAWLQDPMQLLCELASSHCPVGAPINSPFIPHLIRKCRMQSRLS